MKKLLLFLLFPLPLLPQAATINGGTTYQVIDGFGAAQAFSGPTSTTPINIEYSSTGIGLKYIRTQIYPDNADCVAKEGQPCVSAAQGGTIGSSDLAVVQAAASNGAVLWGAMWSPPASMKSNGSFQGTGNMIGNPTNYAALATIQASFVTLLTGTYGIPVYAISVQNEPNVTVSYQSCLWTSTQIHDYIPYLKAALTSAGYPNVKIMISEPGQWALGPTYSSTSMNDSSVAADVGILANHQYDDTFAAQSYSNVTTQHLWETEVSDFNTYDGSMTSGLTYGLLIHNSLVTAKVNAWHYWLATDAAGRGDNEALTSSSYSIAKRAYVMGQWARFVTGMTEISATANPQSGVYVTAFKNPSTGAFAIVTINQNSGLVTQTYNLTGLSAPSVTPYVTNPSSNIAALSSVPISGGVLSTTLTGSSVTTFVSNGSTPTINCASGFASSGACGVSFIGGSGQPWGVEGTNDGLTPALSGTAVNLIPHPTTHAALSLLYQTPVNVQAFTSTFTWLHNGHNVAFTLNNASNLSTGPGGVSAGAGCEGGFFQAFGTSPNNILAVNLDSGNAPASSGGFYSNAQVYQSQQDPCNPTYNSDYFTTKTSTSPVPLNNPATTALTTFSPQHVFSATLTYDGTTLTLNLFDVTAGGACPGASCFTKTWSNINIPSIVNGNTAYVGLMGGTNSDAPAALLINTFTYTVNSPPSVPSSSTYTTSAGAPFATAPVFSPVAGSYTGTQNVTISNSTGGSYFCYVLSSTTPAIFPWPDSLGGCANGTKYTGPVPVSSSQTLYAIAGTNGSTGLPSALATGSYTISSGSFPWTGLLAPSRATVWGTAGAAIENRTTVCATLGLASQTSQFVQNVTAAQISAAIAACPAHQVVMLNTGTYQVSTSVMGPGNGGAWPNNVTLRGAGANLTIIKPTAMTNNCLGYGPTAVCMYNGSSGVAQYADNIMTVTAGVSGGATSITLGSAAPINTCSTGSACPGNISNLHVGSLMEINQQDDCNDTGDWFESGYGPNLGNHCQLVTWGGTSNAWPPNWPAGTTNLGRSLTQVVKVTGISGSTITFSPALIGAKWNQSKSPLAIYSNAGPLVGASIENLQINTSLLGDEQAMLGTVWNNSCWYTNISFVNPTTTSTGLATRKHALLASGLNNSFINNYMYGSASGSDAYGVDQVQGETSDLIQNNIAHHMASAFMTETAVGSVFGYNFDADNYYFNGNGAQWQQAELYHHDAGDMFNLYEGHEGIEAIDDDIHGTSFGLTYFRNYLSGHDKATMCPGGGNACGTSAAGKIQNTAAFDDFAFARYDNFALNVIGDGTYANTYNNVGSQGSPNSCPGFSWTVLYTLNFSNSNQQPFSPNCTGTSYTIDNDSLVATSLMRWGNYDTVTGTVRTVMGENGSGAPTYPALSSPSTSYSSFPSLYLPGKPVWWQFINGNASTPFPATGPDVTGGNIASVGGHSYHNPAGNCYLNVLGGKQDGSSGPLTYDASFCYPTTAPPQAATPVSSPTPGSYSGPLNVTFTDSTPASSMFCTTDGSTPTPASAPYPSGGYTLSATGTYQCVATAAGYTTSAVGGGTFTISTSTLAAPTFSPVTTPAYYLTLPSVTITVPGGSTRCVTTDGTTPTATAGSCTHGSTSSPVTPTSGVPLQALATQSGFNNSALTSATYIHTNIVPDGDGLFNGGSASLTTASLTMSPTPAAGDGITVEAVWGNQTTTATVSDPTGTCTPVPSVTGYTNPFYNSTTFSTSEVWTCSNTPGGSASITLNLSASTPFVGFAAQAWKPAAIGTFTVDTAVLKQASGNGTTANTASATPANPNELILPYLMNLQRNASAGAGFYAIDFLPNGPQLFPEYQIQTTAAAVNAPFTIASSDNWTASQIGGYFAAVNYVLSTAIAGSGGGTITGCAGTYSSGAPYSCTINATAPATITSVTGCGGTLTGITYAGTMPASPCTVTATFGSPTAATPVPSPSPGSYAGQQVVSFTDSTTGANLYCTLDGTTPVAGGPPYSGPYTVSATTTIKCLAAAPGYVNSAVGGGTYTITVAPQPPVSITGTMKLSGSVVLQ